LFKRHDVFVYSVILASLKWEFSVDKLECGADYTSSYSPGVQMAGYVRLSIYLQKVLKLRH
jgi:hypothetical protein